MTTDTNIQYHPGSRRLTADLDGTKVDLLPVMNKLGEIGKDLSTNPDSRSHLVHHNGWNRVPHQDLYGAAVSASGKYAARLPKRFEEYVDLAATHMALGLDQAKRISLDEKVYTPQLITSLGDIGLTWLDTEDKDEAKHLIMMAGIPIMLPGGKMSEKEREIAFRSEYKIIDEIALVREAVETYDQARSRKDHPDNKTIGSLKIDEQDLEKIWVEVGFELYNRGLAKVVFHEGE